MRIDDAQLVQRCLDGDTEAYSRLVERYEKPVYAVAYYYVGRYGVAEDISQEAFLAAYKGLAGLIDRGRFGPWIKEIASRTAANWLRKHGKRLQAETPLPFRRTVSIEDAREGPRGHLERAERLKLVESAIDSLPERYRLPLVLRYLQELSYDEIAEFTGQTRDEVRGLLQVAGRRLRDLLGDVESASRESTKWHHARE